MRLRVRSLMLYFQDTFDDQVIANKFVVSPMFSLDYLGQMLADLNPGEDTQGKDSAGLLCLSLAGLAHLCNLVYKLEIQLFRFVVSLA